MSVYGDMLGAFSELFKNYEVFYMAPLVRGGYGPHEKTDTIRGIRLSVRGGQLVVENDTKSAVDTPVFFTRERVPVGYFVQDDVLYRIVGDNGQKRTGNFYMYTLQSVVGNTGVQAAWTDGITNARKNS